MKSAEIRERFLKYFESKGHKILPGSSLVPLDPTVLLTLAGMLQFKPIFLGQEKPKHKKVTTVQKCIRMIDIGEVGKTPRHHTFFEMLGNFSFGEYFKKEAIEYAWELLTKEFKLPKEKLVIAVFEKDDEAYTIWHEKMGLEAEKIVRLDEENNFWAAGPTGPCGPCSEIYYDFGPKRGCGKPDCQPGCDCDRFLEVWNLVFIQYNRNEKGELLPLKSKGIDTGMGLERIASILQGGESNFETDLFAHLLEEIDRLPRFEGSPHVIHPVAKRIIADHIRAATHLISDQVLPSNEGRGYVLRRLIRRIVLYAKLNGLKLPLTSILASLVIDQMGSAYPNLRENQEMILKALVQEEENFIRTLDQGLAIFNGLLKKFLGEKEIPGGEVFRLHDTYGFPLEISKELAEKEGLKVDEKGFEQEMEKQRERARKAGIPTEKKKELMALDFAGVKPTNFEGYEKTSLETKVVRIFPDKKYVVLEKTPFYGESGGQVGDTGILKIGSEEVHVLNALALPQGVIVHEVDSVGGLKDKIKIGATIDASRRRAIELHHTATHLLHKALQEVLGEHVKQAGSYVGPDKLRFDFTHFSACKHSEIEKVEEIVNQRIKEQLKVEVLQKSYHDAVKMGAMALFGEKYGDKVRVLKVGDYSLELCGGTHAKSTGDILFFKILAEGALGYGIRRIEAVAGQVARVTILHQAKSLRDKVEQLIPKYRELEVEKEKLGGTKMLETGIFAIDVTELDRISKAVDDQDSANVKKFLEHLEGRLEWMQERVARAEKECRLLKLKEVSKDSGSFASEAKEIGGCKVLLKGFKDYTMEMLRSISDNVQNQLKSVVIVLASSLAGRVIFLVTVTPDLVAKGYSAKKIVDVFSPLIKGRGGGRDEKVEGGGKDATQLNEAFEEVFQLLGK